MIYRIFIKYYAGRESHYGDCDTWAEVQKEIRGHLRSLGLEYRIMKLGPAFSREASPQHA